MCGNTWRTREPNLAIESTLATSLSYQVDIFSKRTSFLIHYLSLETKFIVDGGGGGHGDGKHDLCGDGPIKANLTASLLIFLLLVN
jgi:hypothetical protein